MPTCLGAGRGVGRSGWWHMGDTCRNVWGPKKTSSKDPIFVGWI
jgi:hypothetical protein